MTLSYYSVIVSVYIVYFCLCLFSDAHSIRTDLQQKRDDFLKIAVTNMMLLLEKTRGV